MRAGSVQIVAMRGIRPNSIAVQNNELEININLPKMRQILVTIIQTINKSSHCFYIIIIIIYYLGVLKISSNLYQW